MKRLSRITTISSLVLANLASAQSYNFTVDPRLSYFKGGFTGTLNMSGSFLGNYDSKTGLGTRTKPGWNGAWPAGENDRVPISGLATCASKANSSASGAFRLSVDIAKMKVEMTGYSTSMFTLNPASMVAAFSPKFGAFRTQSPTFFYPGISATIPVGPVTFGNLTIVQTATIGKGVLRQVSSTYYQFAITYEATLTFKVATGGQVKTVSHLMPLAFLGNLYLSGKGAKVTAHLWEKDQTLSLQQTVPLPTIKFDLPAASAQAHLLADLQIDSAGLKADHSASLVATAIASN